MALGCGPRQSRMEKYLEEESAQVPGVEVIACCAPEFLWRVGHEMIDFSDGGAGDGEE